MSYSSSLNLTWIYLLQVFDLYPRLTVQAYSHACLLLSNELGIDSYRKAIRTITLSPAKALEQIILLILCQVYDAEYV